MRETAEDTTQEQAFNHDVLKKKKRASLVAQTVKNLPAMRETWVQPLGWEDPLEKVRLPPPLFWTGEFHGLYSPWSHKSWTQLSDFHFQKRM